MSDDTRHDRIRDRAYALWQQAGEPEDQEEYFWHLAERMIDDEDSRRTIPRQPKFKYGVIAVRGFEHTGRGRDGE